MTNFEAAPQIEAIPDNKIPKTIEQISSSSISKPSVLITIGYSLFLAAGVGVGMASIF
ncbi:MAG: hypothetical protein F6K57_31335, partial [Moorea sp. SIO4A5]|nr:hypothetical protein [Moorena sp. SIO4A5]